MLGGDEFLVVIDGAAGDIPERIAQVKRQMNGDYTLPTADGKRKVSITAAVGIGVWKPANTAQELLHAADQAMYQDKRSAPPRNQAISASRTL